MDRKAFYRVLSLVCAAAVAASPVLPFTAELFSADVWAGEQLGQNDFDSGVGLPWHVCESTTGKMDFEIDNGVYKITIVNPGGASNGGEDRWDCQFRHRGLKIVSGHQYRVSYEITPSNSGKYYTKIGNLEGDVEVWHNMSNGYDLDSTWDPIYIGANETKRVDLTFTAGMNIDVAEWAFHLGGDGQYTPGGCFPAGTVITFDNMSLTDLSSNENDYVDVPPRERASIVTNQVGYLTGRCKQATLISDEKKPLDMYLKDTSGNTVYEFKSRPFGNDSDSGDSVHILDLTDFDTEGEYYLECENGKKSRSFVIGGTGEYSRLLYDSLNYFYQNRSGIPIESAYISSGDKDALSRAAGHVTDNAQIQHTWGYSGTSGSIDVSGGWYDAGDHGKYTVNGGLSLWLLQNEYETASAYGYDAVFGDGTMYLPENGDGFPDLLNEARYEAEWMFKMVIDGGEYDGCVYHKAHDETWTGLGIAPAEDDKNRIVKPPTTAATLNFAACMAQSARLWAGLDDDFSQKCVNAAVKSYAAAKAHPDMFAPLDESVGGGAYGDDDVTDEFYWAACELFVTTGDKSYYEDMKKSKFFLAVPSDLSGGESVDSCGTFDWGNTAALGTFSLALHPSFLDESDRKKAESNIVKTADYFLETGEKQGYGLPYKSSTIAYNDSDKGFQWGSNSFAVDNAIAEAYAYLLTGEDKYLDGTVRTMDYILGRNPNDISYVTGYGAYTAENPHHRYWSKQIDPMYPSAPDGVMVGGPNSGMQDPWVKGSGWKKGQIPPEKCYLDHIEAWSVNECCINWNASLAWLTGFVAVESGGVSINRTSPGASAKPQSYEVSETETVYDGTADDADNAGNEERITPQKEDAEDEDSVRVTASTEAVKEKDDDSEKDKDKSDNSGIIKVAIIAGAAVIALISLELFILRIIKLKNNDKK